MLLAIFPLTIPLVVLMASAAMAADGPYPLEHTFCENPAKYPIFWSEPPTLDPGCKLLRSHRPKQVKLRLCRTHARSDSLRLGGSGVGVHRILRQGQSERNVLFELMLPCSPRKLGENTLESTMVSLEQNVPVPRAVEDRSQGEVLSIPQVGGLHHRYTRAA